MLNIIISELSQKQHLAYSCAFFILYFCLESVKVGLFFASELIYFVGIYFIVAYIKKYNFKLISNIKVNCIFLFAGIILLILLQLSMNFVGFQIGTIGQHMKHFMTNHNPIIFIIAFSLFNIFRNLKIQNNLVNYISSLTMHLFVIHNNNLFKIYLRPVLMFNFWEAVRLDLILFVLICGVILFTASTLAAITYNKLLEPIAHKIAEKILQIGLKIYARFESLMLKIE